MKFSFLKLILIPLLLILFIMVIALSPYTTTKNEQFDGYSITEYRRHYPLDIEDGGLGRYIDQKLCIDKLNVCTRAKDVFYSYPTKFINAHWSQLCDANSSRWRFFDLAAQVELKCLNCDSEALRCPKPPQTGSWFDNGNQSAELVGYAKENMSTVRTFSYGTDGITMREFPSLKGVAYGAGEIISEWFYGDKSAMAWIQCDKKKCNAYRVDFKTGHSTQEATPCQYGDLLTFVLVGDRPEIRVDSEAKNEEICRDAQGKQAYPLGPEPESSHSQPIDAAHVETPQLPVDVADKQSEVH